MANHKITNLADATVATDALNRQTADSRYYLSSTALSAITAPSGNLSMNSHKITSLLDPTSAQDAATKTYVDTQISSNLNSTANITNATNSDSSLTAASTELTNGLTPLNMNS